jgi:hypothetical protein
MSEIKISSNKQSGGITAQNVNSSGVSTSLEEGKKKIFPWGNFWAVIGVIIAVIGLAITIYTLINK